MSDQNQIFEAEAQAFFSANPDIERLEVLYLGLCGPLRGKWVPVKSLSKLISGELSFPTATAGLDIWGHDVDEMALAIATGDPDGVALPVAGSLKRVPWADTPTAQALVTLTMPDHKTPSPYDPRAVLEAVVNRFSKAGLTPVVATELEFYLIDRKLGEAGHPQPPIIPHTTERLSSSQVFDMDVLSQFSGVIGDINQSCLEQNIPADTTIAEFGCGQFEVNLVHVADALKAADLCVEFKRLVKNIARKHGMDATFMAKPYTESTGNGLHLHISLLNQAGENIFSGSHKELSQPLKHAVGGLMATMKDMHLIFAPHGNSYRRFQLAYYAPSTQCWGFDHRGVAIRLPQTSGPNARLEHRIAGADANPYLVTAAVLHGILMGLEQKLDPGKPIEKLEEITECPPLTQSWKQAIADWSKSEQAKTLGTSEFFRVYLAGRKSEWETYASTVTDFDCQTYLRKV
ncbi:glutamine synthetase [Pseudovibrio japonicus]|uniref:Glutamine synthetase n=1 Tax=Pseudovibrio japonicus TaxID=366534 RepID=A0ABQ3EM19_9HYPH|nr:glutamine synthetase family protein [Pseudovibrio japonicus]GHB40575.1 glutamine synthetase [Pseudovibrio japonicus]